MADKKPRKKTTYKGPSGNTVKVKQSEAETAKANAEAAKAASEAEAAKTRARELELQERRAEREAKEKRRQEDASPTNQITDAAKIAVPIVAGLAYGKQQANKIAAETVAINAKKTKNLKAVAEGLREASDLPGQPGALITDRNKLKAGVRTAAKQKLLKGAGKAGLGAAAILVAEGVAARVGAGYIENETMKEIVSGAGTGLTVAGGSLLATRALQRAGEAASVNAADAATIEAAKTSLKNKTPPAEPKPAASAAPEKPAKASAKPRDAASKKLVKGMSSASAPATATGATAMGAADDVTSRLAGLKKADLAKVAKDMGIPSNSKTTAKALRTAIGSEMARQSHAAYKGTVAGQEASAWGGKSGVDRGAAEKAAKAAKGQTAAKISAAIDKATGGPRGFANEAVQKAAQAGRAAASNVDDLIASTKKVLATHTAASPERAKALSDAAAQITNAKLSKADAHKLAAALDLPVSKSTSGKAAAGRVAKLLNSTSTAVHKILAVGGRGVSALATPVLAGGAALLAMNQSSEAGETTAQTVARGVTAAADTAAFGIPSMVADAVKSKETITIDHRAQAREAQAAEAERIQKAGGKLTKAQAKALAEKNNADDAMAAAKDVAVQLGAIAAGSAGGAAVMIGKDIVKEGIRPTPNIFDDAPSALRRVARVAGGTGMMVVGGIAAGGALVALANRAKADKAPSGDGKIGFQNEDTLNAALDAQGKADKGDAKPRATGKNGPQRLNASQKAQLRQANASIEKARAAKPADPAAKPESDGFTDPHRRRGPNGQIVQVSGFRTTLPSR